MCGACQRQQEIYKAMTLTCHGPVSSEMGVFFAKRVVRSQPLRKALEKCRDSGVTVLLENSREIRRRAGPDEGISVGIECVEETIVYFIDGYLKARLPQAA